MKRLLTVALIVVPAAALLAGPVNPWIPPTLNLEPLGTKQMAVACVPFRSAVALVSGGGRSALGLYVYGPNGQCVGADDDVLGRVDDDDRVVAFLPISAGPYEMEIRNFGNRANSVQAAFRASGGSE